MAETEPQSAELEVPEDQAPANRQQPRNLNEWLELLSEKGMPAFAATVKEISGVANNRESSASELSRVVLQDAAMTSKLLKVANSPMYNLVTTKGISTVSRAVVLLGFDVVRSMCLSIKMVESVSKGAQREHLSMDMARSFHAAVQAQSFAEKRRDQNPEEVFIATLLLNLGKMAFWSHPSEAAEEIHELMMNGHPDLDTLMKKRYGFEMNDLSIGLTKQWQIGGLLQSALEGSASDDPRISNVQLAHQLATLAEQGWDTPEMKKLLAHIAETLYLPLKDLQKMVHENASEAANTAACFGAGKAVELIPLPASQSKKPARAVKTSEQKEVQKFPEPDMNLQLKILRELSSMVEGKFDINLLLEMVLEGMHRGVGMDRALFALLSQDRKVLKARYALGWNHQEIRDRFGFEMSDVKANIFSHVIENSLSLWMHDDVDPLLRMLVTDEVKHVTQGAPFFVMPIEIQGKGIGVFYADRQPSGRRLIEDSYDSFKHFGNQANMALSFNRRK